MVRSATKVPNSRLDAIARAKREWECIVDSLPQLLLLLNRAGEIQRANRAVERWSVGKVRGVLGLDLHALFHRDCDQPRCDLQRLLGQAWASLGDPAGGEFEIADATLNKTIKVELRHLPDPGHEPGDPFGHYAVCIVSDVTQLRSAQQGQLLLRQELEQRVHSRTQELTAAVYGLKSEVTRRELAELSLRTSRNKLRKLSDQLVRAQEMERKRIAQDLHDAVGQSLSAIKYSLECAIQLMGSTQLGNPLPVLNKTVEQVQNTIDEVRSISENLRPALLDGLGAVSAIRWLCREWSEVFIDIDLQINLDVADNDIHEQLGTTVFRTVQEALNNIARHSKASHVTVSMSKEPDALRLDVADDGVGFEPDGATTQCGYGIAGMRERAASIGGRFHLTSYVGGGTQLTVIWPLHAPSNPGEIILCST